MHSNLRFYSGSHSLNGKRPLLVIALHERDGDNTHRIPRRHTAEWFVVLMDKEPLFICGAVDVNQLRPQHPIPKIYSSDLLAAQALEEATEGLLSHPANSSRTSPQKLTTHFEFRQEANSDALARFILFTSKGKALGNVLNQFTENPDLQTLLATILDASGSAYPHTDRVLKNRDEW